MPLLWLSTAFLLGICAARLTGFSLWAWVVIGTGCCVFLAVEQRTLKKFEPWIRLRTWIPVPIGMVLLLFVCGGVRQTLAHHQVLPSELAYYNDHGYYTMTGVVSSPPDRREEAVYLDISILEIENPGNRDPLNSVSSIHGTARVKLPASAGWEFGDILRFYARPVTPSEDGDFSYRAYLEQQKIQTVIYFPQYIELVEQSRVNSIRLTLERLRQKARLTIFKQLPQPESGLLAGILLGLDNDLPKNLEKAYQLTGTAHVIAISGFNMTLLMGLFTSVFRRISNRYWAAVMSIFAVGLYTLFVDGSPSVVRAAIMSATALVGHLIGRRQSGLNALGFTAGLMCLENPLLPWDVSFQLSFAATLGLVLLAEPMKTWLDRWLEGRLSEEKSKRMSGPLSEYLLFTLAAQITTLPIIAIHFGRISISSLLSNPLILPVQPIILILGGLSTIAGMVFSPLGQFLALGVWVPMRYTNTVVELLSKIKGASLSIHPQMAKWILVTLLVFILVFILRNFFMKLFSKNLIGFVFFLVLGTAVAWSIIVHRPDWLLHIDLIRLSNESGVYVREPQGKVILFDPGKEVNELAAEVEHDLSPWKFHIDEVWLMERKSANNLTLLSQRIPIYKAILAANVYMAGKDQFPVRIPAGIETVRLPADGQVSSISGINISVIGDEINTSAIFLEYKGMRLLIPNGVDYALLRETAPEKMNKLTLLVLQEEDISYIPPRVWKNLGAQLVLWNGATLSPEPGWLGTDIYSRISIITDGEDFLVKTYR